MNTVTHNTTGNTQLSSASNCINGGVDTYGCNSCVHCHCGCHCAKKLEAKKAAEAAYFDSLPIGCRFLPTDKELIVHYLRKKIKNESLPKNRISEANVYGYHPKDLAANYPQAMEGVWYFFSSRDRKYGRGNRPRRSAGSGYWKATGLDNVIKDNDVKIGARKSLVYYEGHQSNGTKTSWMMHEYVAKGYERQPLGSDDKKFDDYVLCKIYINVRKKGEVVSDQQPLVASNDQDENLTTDNHLDQIEQADVVTQYLNESMNLTALDHVDNHLPVVDYNQHMSPSIGQVMVPDQQAHVVSNQDVNPTTFQVENNHMVVQQFNQNSNPTVHHGEPHSSAKTGAKDDQQARMVSSEDINPIVLVENNVVVHNDENMGSLYDLIMKSSARYPKPVEMTSFRPTRASSVNQTCPTRLECTYSLQNPPCFQSTRQRSQSLPSLSGHMHPGTYMYHPSFNPPSPLMAPTAFQDSNECDGRVVFERNIKLMIAKDGYDGLNLDNNYRFQLDTNESKKHA